MTTSDIRRRACVAALAVVLALAGCTDKPTESAADPRSGAADPTTEQATTAFPGLYLTGAAVPVAADDRRIELVSAVPCADLAALLGAGQWRVADELTLPPEAGEAAGLIAGFGVVPGLLLTRGDALAFAALTGDPTCSATISKVTRQKITVAGKGYPGTSPGWAATTSCTGHTGKALSVSLYFDTDARTGGVLRLLLKPTGDTFTVDVKDAMDFSATLFSHRGQLLRAYSGLMKAGSDGRMPPGLRVQGLDPGERFTGTAEISSAPGQPAAGTVTMTGLVDEDTGAGDLRLTLPFACAKVAELG